MKQVKCDRAKYKRKVYRKEAEEEENRIREQQVNIDGR
jgi:hypothetical protein